MDLLARNMPAVLYCASVRKIKSGHQVEGIDPRPYMGSEVRTAQTNDNPTGAVLALGGTAEMAT